MGELPCSRWSLGDTPDKGGWTYVPCPGPGRNHYRSMVALGFCRIGNPDYWSSGPLTSRNKAVNNSVPSRNYGSESSLTAYHSFICLNRAITLLGSSVRLFSTLRLRLVVFSRSREDSSITRFWAHAPRLISTAFIITGAQLSAGKFVALESNVERRHKFWISQYSYWSLCGHRRKWILLQSNVQ